MDDSPGVWKEGGAGEDPGETSHGASGCSQVGSFCPPRDQVGARLKASVAGAQSSSVGRTVRGGGCFSLQTSHPLLGGVQAAGGCALAGWHWLLPLLVNLHLPARMGQFPDSSSSS